MSKLSKVAAAMAALLFLSACAGEITDRGLAEVSAVTEAKLGRKVGWQRDAASRDVARGRVRELLAQPIDAESVSPRRISPRQAGRPIRASPIPAPRPAACARSSAPSPAMCLGC
jgi:hypothetical protein